MAISPRVGQVIDSIDIRYYRLFYSLKDVTSASTYLYNSDKILFLVKRNAQSDTILTYPIGLFSTSLTSYIENIERISEESVYSKISTARIVDIAHIEDYDARTYSDVNITITKRDASEINGKILLITGDAIFVQQREEHYNWKNIRSGLIQIPFGDIDKFDGSDVRSFAGNKRLIVNYLESEYLKEPNTSYFITSTLRPMPVEVRQILESKEFVVIERNDFISEDSLRNLKPVSYNLRLGFGLGYQFSYLFKLHVRDWNNHGLEEKNTDFSLELPTELSVEYTVLKDKHADKWSVSGHLAFLTNFIPTSENTWIGGRAGAQGTYIFNPIDRLNTKGVEYSGFVGIDYVTAIFSVNARRIQGSDELPLDNIVKPITLIANTFVLNAGVSTKFQFNEKLAVSLQLSANFILNEYTEGSEKLKWGINGRYFYKSFEISVLSKAISVGALVSYSI